MRSTYAPITAAIKAGAHAVVANAIMATMEVTAPCACATSADLGSTTPLPLIRLTLLAWSAPTWDFAIGKRACVSAETVLQAGHATG